MISLLKRFHNYLDDYTIYMSGSNVTVYVKKEYEHDSNAQIKAYLKNKLILQIQATEIMHTINKSHATYYVFLGYFNKEERCVDNKKLFIVNANTGKIFISEPDVNIGFDIVGNVLVYSVNEIRKTVRGEEDTVKYNLLTLSPCDNDLTPYDCHEDFLEEIDKVSYSFDYLKHADNGALFLYSKEAKKYLAITKHTFSENHVMTVICDSVTKVTRFNAYILKNKSGYFFVGNRGYLTMKIFKDIKVSGDKVTALCDNGKWFDLDIFTGRLKMFGNNFLSDWDSNTRFVKVESGEILLIDINDNVVKSGITKIISPFEHREASTVFSEYLAEVEIDGREVFITLDGEEIEKTPNY